MKKAWQDDVSQKFSILLCNGVKIQENCTPTKIFKRNFPISSETGTPQDHFNNNAKRLKSFKFVCLENKIPKNLLKIVASPINKELDQLPF